MHVKFYLLNGSPQKQIGVEQSEQSQSRAKNRIADKPGTELCAQEAKRIEQRRFADRRRTLHDQSAYEAGGFGELTSADAISIVMV